jgi:squalene-associated FAD-dependent desaturase
MRRAHVIGAGLAGLSAALHLARAGVSVTVFEAAPHAGGRCRSLNDSLLDTVIDNGAHLMLSGNTEVRAYLDMIGAADEAVSSESARFDFFDVASGRRWSLDLGCGHGRMNVFRSLMRLKNRPPGVGLVTLLKDMNALKSGSGKTVAACVGRSKALSVFWEPLCVAVLNAHPSDASAALLWRVLEETVMKGGAFACPLSLHRGLGAALIDPALAMLGRLNADVRLSQRVRGLNFDAERIAGLNLGEKADVLGKDDFVILAVPHFAVHDLLPGVSAPKESRAILNVHYRLPEGGLTERLDGPSMIGLINSAAQWVFVRGDVASVTVSAADAWMDQDADVIAQSLWPDVAQALGVKALGVKALGVQVGIPPYRVIKERRATFAQTPASLALRPGPSTTFKNLYLAGDWTETELPATIEGALKSGRVAAEAALNA